MSGTQEYYYERNKLLSALPTTIIVVVVIISSLWIVDRVADAVIKNATDVQLVRTDLTKLRDKVVEMKNEISQMGEVLRSTLDHQTEMVNIVRENNASIRLLEQHPLLREDYGDFGRRAPGQR